LGERQATSSPLFWYRTSKQITFGFNNIMNLKCNCLNNKRFNLPDVGVIPPKVDKYYWPPIFIGGICTTTEPQPETGWIKYYSAKHHLILYTRNSEKVLHNLLLIIIQPVPGCCQSHFYYPPAAPGVINIQLLRSLHLNILILWIPNACQTEAPVSRGPFWLTLNFSNIESGQN